LVQRLKWHLEQLDGLEELREKSETSLKKEGRRHHGCRVLRSVPGIGPIRAAQIVGMVDTPHRFRTKRQFWSYVGLAVVTKSSSDFIPTPRGFVRKKWRVTRGLNRNCNRFLKACLQEGRQRCCRQLREMESLLRQLGRTRFASGDRSGDGSEKNRRHLLGGLEEGRALRNKQSLGVNRMALV
jgi:hypothetical protein